MQIYTGYHHVAALTTMDEVLVWGNKRFDVFSEPGIKNQELSSPVPTRISLENVVDISYGHSYMAAITINGEIFTWGKNSLGHLGRRTKEYTNCYVPTRIQDLPNVTEIACGDNFAAALTKEGKLRILGDPSFFDWKNREFLDISLLNLKIVNSTHYPEILELENIADIAYGNKYLMVITKKGQIFSFGENPYKGLEGQKPYNQIPQPLSNSSLRQMQQLDSLRESKEIAQKVNNTIKKRNSSDYQQAAEQVYQEYAAQNSHHTVEQAGTKKMRLIHNLL